MKILYCVLLAAISMTSYISRGPASVIHTCEYTEQIINATDYGAIPNDGIDDTDSIRHIFLNVLDPNKGATVSFPEGTYLLNPSEQKSMEIMGNCRKIEGVKGQTIFKLMDNSIDPGLRNTVSPVPRLLEGVLLGNMDRKRVDTYNSNIVVRNIIFDGNCRTNPLQDDPTYVGVNNTIFFHQVKNLTIEHCEVFNSCSAGFVLVQCENSLIQKNHLFDVGQGVRNADAIQVNGCINTTIKDNLLENTGEGIFCQHHSNTNIPDQECKIINNIIRILDYNGKCLSPQYPYPCCDSLMSGDSLNFRCRRGKARGSSIGILSQNSYAANNYIERHFPLTIHAQTLHADVPTKDVKVYNNTLVEISKFNSTSGGAIWLVSDNDNYLSNIEVFDNTIIDSYASGISFEYSDRSVNQGQISDIRIYNNRIEGACLGFGKIIGYRTDPTGQPIPIRYSKCAGLMFSNKAFEHQIDRFRDIRIEKNVFSNINPYAIWLDRGAKRIVFENNTFENYQVKLLNTQCFLPGLGCPGRTIDTYKNNSPFLKTDASLIAKLMRKNGDLFNYCLDCDDGTANLKGCFVSQQNGIWNCK